jgi:hypothetical protein
MFQSRVFRSFPWRGFCLASCLVAAPLQAQSGLFVTTTDFASGSTAFVAGGADQAEVNLLNIHSDAIGHYYDGKIYVVNRLGQDNVIVLDPGDLTAPLIQFSVGNGSNPHDIEIVAPDKAYVTLYGTTDLLIVNPQDGSPLGLIDLSAFADSDGLPEVSQITRLGDRLYLSCQRLDRDNGWGPVGDSFLIVVDIASDTLVDVDPQAEGIQGILLSVANPNSVVAIGDRIAVGVISNFGDRVGGIDIVDPISNASLGLAISEADLGGDITFLAMVNNVEGYAIVTDENFVNIVRPVNLETGQVGAALDNLSGGFIPSIAVDGDRLLVADRGSFSAPEDAGVKVFDAQTGLFLQGPIDTGLPPSSLVVLDDRPLPTAVETSVQANGVGPQSASLDPAYPNPFNATIQIPFVTAGQASAAVVVFDLLGRRIRTLATGYLGVGRHVVSWDGRDDAGHLVSNGAYMVRLYQGGRQAVAKVMLLK